jgi:tRNA (cytidine/uridine-2'-O-)-methyltransferase
VSDSAEDSPRLRASAPARPFHVVLVEPEIPPNTGNVARLCAATGSALHLVGTLGFRVDEHAVRRAGLDYWHLVDVRRHATLAEAEASIGATAPRGVAPDAAAAPGPVACRSFLFTGHAERSYLDVEFEPGDVFVFGKESVGLPRELLAERREQTLGIPLLGGVRSHNLANSVAIVLYEALRQTGALAGARLTVSAR